jgi:hypothetical protein
MMAGQHILPLTFRAQKYLRGVSYPASKAQLLKHAWQRGAGEDTHLSQVLLALPERLYEDPIDVVDELARVDATMTRKNGRRP